MSQPCVPYDCWAAFQALLPKEHSSRAAAARACLSAPTLARNLDLQDYGCQTTYTCPGAPFERCCKTPSRPAKSSQLSDWEDSTSPWLRSLSIPRAAMFPRAT